MGRSLADQGIKAEVLSPARPIILQGSLPDGARFDLRAFGDRVGLRTWPPGVRWQQEITDGDGSTRTIPDICTADFFATLDGWRWGEAAMLAADDIGAALDALLAQRG